MFDTAGYLKVIDFGLAKHIPYVPGQSPVMLGKGKGKAGGAVGGATAYRPPPPPARASKRKSIVEVLGLGKSSSAVPGQVRGKGVCRRAGARVFNVPPLRACMTVALLGTLAVASHGSLSRFTKKAQNNIHRTLHQVQKSFTVCGTTEYLSPEAVSGKGHDRSIDHWALGCLLYELFVGRTPFRAKQSEQTLANICDSKRHLAQHPFFTVRAMKREIGLRRVRGSCHFAWPRGCNAFSSCPSHLPNPLPPPRVCFQHGPPDAVNLVLGLLDPNPATRLGNGAKSWAAVTTHPFFSKPCDATGLAEVSAWGAGGGGDGGAAAAMDWDALMARAVPAPFTPSVANAVDTSGFEDEAPPDLCDEPEEVPPFGGDPRAFDGFGSEFARDSAFSTIPQHSSAQLAALE